MPAIQVTALKFLSCFNFFVFQHIILSFFLGFRSFEEKVTLSLAVGACYQSGSNNKTNVVRICLFELMYAFLEPS